MEITALQRSHLPAAAELFAASFRRLRRSVPILPETLQEPDCTAHKLEHLLEHSTGLAALEDGRLAGYLAWWLVDDFRSTQRRAGYVPVWAHAVAEAQEAPARRVTLALYHAAAQSWYDAGCRVQALTRLADDPLLHDFWFWNGFGALVVDAVRPAAPLGLPAPQDLRIRQAALEDAPLMAALEAEHWQHYSQPPVLMMANAPSSAEECAALIANPANSVWLAFEGQQAAGYMRFEAATEGASDIVASDSTSACSGAYTRPAYRGRGAAQALLDTALRHLAEQGMRRCSVDFESINPPASAFWLRFFTPVCISVMRTPEKG